MTRTILLDRDGTIIEECHYLADPDAVRLLPRAAEGLRRLQALGWGFVVLTNQSAIGRGRLTEERLAAINARVEALLAAEGVRVAGIYYCPHTSEDGCSCRKPLPGLVQRAVRDLGFDPRQSVVIGDKRCDVELGRAVGARTVLVRTGYGAQELEQGGFCPDAVADDLLAASEVIARWAEAGPSFPERGPAFRAGTTAAGGSP